MGRVLVEEGTVGDSQVVERGELAELVDLGPVVDLGGGDVEGVEAGGQGCQGGGVREQGDWALGQGEQLQSVYDQFRNPQ